MSEIQDFSIKYRPTTLDEIVGNKVTVNKIKRFIETSTFPKSSIFVGDKGCGKTTCVYILKKLLKCADINFHEINGADSGTVEDAREIVKELQFTPMGKSKTKIYFIDEAHALTAKAMSVLLKDTEDAKNKFTYFMFASNHPEKINDALLSRFTQFKLNTLSDIEIARDLLYPICQKENLDIDKPVLMEIGKACNGSSREALVMLNSIRFVDKEEQLNDIQKLTCNSKEHVNIMSGLLYNKINYKDCLIALNALESDPESFRMQMLCYMGNQLSSHTVSSEIKKRAYQLACYFSEPYYNTSKCGLYMTIFEIFNN